MLLSKNLRRYAIRRWKLDADSTDAEVQKVVGQKMLDGKFSRADLKRVNAGKKPAKATAGGGGTDDDDRPAPKKKGTPAPKKKGTPAGRDADDRTRRRKAARTDDAMDAKAIAKQAARIMSKRMERLGLTPKRGDVNPATAFSKATRITVKEAAKQYSTTKKGAVYPTNVGINGAKGQHPFAGQPVRLDGVSLDHPSDRDKAIALAWLRYMTQRTNKGGDLPQWLRMTDHDRELVYFALHNEKWTGLLKSHGEVSSINRAKLSEFQVKTLLDDSTSGGIEITPVVFDDALILIPVLYGELFPYVNVVNIARGRRIKGGSVINPTFTSGVGEGTAITPFNTASYVSAFDTAVYPAVAAIELGQDFEEDSPVDLGGQVIEQFGLKALEWLDRVIAVGNGYNEPLGIFNATAATVLNSVYGAGGPLTVSDFEGLMLQGLAKQYRAEPGAFLAYVGNDYTYRKGVSIPVGPGDERRVFGMDHADYTILKTPFKVQNDIPDGYLAYANLRRYRMYRRLGMQVRVETGGRQLALSNTRLIVVRMRYGGQPEIGGAFGVMKDSQVM